MFISLRDLPYLILCFTFKSGISGDIEGNYVFLNHMIVMLRDRERVSQVYF